MDLDTERTNRMFNLWMIALLIVFVVGFVIGAVSMWLVSKI